MEIFSEINEQFNLSLALGFFDGVHRGHQAVINAAVKYAKAQNTKSAVITFNEHPSAYFNVISPKYIHSRSERILQMEKLGVDYLYELNFKDYAHVLAEDYLKNILIKYFKPIAIATGFNHYFGAEKSGNAELLKKNSDLYNYKYFMIDAERDDNNIISSTVIKKFLNKGNIIKANSMLGHRFPITGKVIHGQQIGRILGFRTANLTYPSELVNLPYGVYVGKVFIDGIEYTGVTNIGVRPTVSDKQACIIETHILDFDKDIYDKEIRLELIQILREEVKFNSVNDLQNQIKNDILAAVEVSK